jgi:predicted transcriptional regulator YdeE
MNKLLYSYFALTCLSVAFLNIEGTQMNYTITQLDREIKISGLKTTNLNLISADQSIHIANAWNTYFGLNLPNPMRTFGVYTDYDKNMNYSMIIGSEFKNQETLPSKLFDFTIPAGKYAVFIVKGKMPEAIQKFWGDFWTNTNNFHFERAFKADFELYGERYFTATPEVDIYISTK